jgi:anti-sigma-K factor RskA
LAQLHQSEDIRPVPDPTLLTTAQLDREIGHLKELMERSRLAQEQALQVALAQTERRLEDLNELRKAVETDRMEFVRVDVYQPAHEELRRQRVADSERAVIMQGDIKKNATDLAELKSSMMWLSRLVIGALVLAIITYAFQRLTGR